MTPSEAQIRLLLLNGCEYARDCDKTCGKATKASCVSRKRAVEALREAWRAGMEGGAKECEALLTERQRLGSVFGGNAEGTDLAALAEAIQAIRHVMNSGIKEEEVTTNEAS